MIIIDKENSTEDQKRDYMLKYQKRNPYGKLKRKLPQKCIQLTLCSNLAASKDLSRINMPSYRG